MGVEKLLQEINTVSGISRAELIRPIVPISEWIENPYYVGDLVYTLYPKYKQHIKSIFDEERDVSDYIDEIILRSSIGTGKTSFINVVLIRKLYELSCYSDIRPLFNLMTSKKLMMVYFSITKEVAENTGYAQLRDMILTIPYFQDNFLPNTKKSYDIEWPERNMKIVSGSNSNQVIGADVIASVIDEGDFYGSTNASTSSDGQALSKAQQLYASIRQRARSRFLVNGINHSLNCILSSPTYASGFISQLLESNRANPHAYIIEETLWTVKPKGTYSSTMFLVFKGTNLIDPCIVEDVSFFKDFYATMYEPCPEMETKDVIEEFHKLPKDKQEFFIEVPIDFKSDFEVNLIKALQDIASVPVAPLGRLFTSNIYYQKAIDNIDSVLIQDEITITTDINDERTIQTYFKPDYVPKHPELPRFLHFDQSITGDEAGVACCYIEAKPNNNGGIDKKVTVEWVVRVLPPKKPQQIDLKKLRSVCYYLRDTLNLQIGKVTFDSYASEEAIQDLDIHNFNVARQSVDKDDKAYQDLVQLYYTESIKHPEHKRYHEELFNLIWYRAKRKIDHPYTCLTKDTLIPLVDGRVLSINDLLLEHSWGKTNYVYSMTDDGIRPKKILNVFKTRYTNELLKITLDNDRVIKCTKDHLFMLRDGTYIQARELKPQMSLMPLYTRVSSKGLDGYRMYYEPTTDKWHYEHRQFCDKYRDVDKTKDSYIVHHCNCNKLDNSPSNLLGMTHEFHSYLHCRLLNNKDRYSKISKSLSEYYRDNKDSASFIARNQKISHTLRKYPIEYYERMKMNKQLKEMKSYIRDIEKYLRKLNICRNILEEYLFTEPKEVIDTLYKVTYSKYSKEHLDKFWGELSNNEKNSVSQKVQHMFNKPKGLEYQERKNNYEKHLRGKLTTKGKIWINNGHERKYINQGEEIPDGYTQGFKLNHKVKSVEIIHESTAVYDLTIEDTHNFALDAGVFVHNCSDGSVGDKGCTDAVCGAVQNALVDVNALYNTLRSGDNDAILSLM